MDQRLSFNRWLLYRGSNFERSTFGRWIGISIVLVFQEQLLVYSGQGSRYGATVLLKMMTPRKMTVSLMPSLIDLPHPSSSSSPLSAFGLDSLEALCEVYVFYLVSANVVSGWTGAGLLLRVSVPSGCSFCVALRSGTVVGTPDCFFISQLCQSSMVVKASLIVSRGQNPPMVPCIFPWVLQMPTKGKAVMAALAKQRSQWTEQSTEQNSKLHYFSCLNCSSTCFSSLQYLQFLVQNLTNLNLPACFTAESKLDQSSRL